MLVPPTRGAVSGRRQNTGSAIDASFGSPHFATSALLGDGAFPRGLPVKPSFAGPVAGFHVIENDVDIFRIGAGVAEERLDAGGMTTSAERMVAAFTSGAPTNNLIIDMSAGERAMAMDSPHYVNSESFARDLSTAIRSLWGSSSSIMPPTTGAT